MLIDQLNAYFLFIYFSNACAQSCPQARHAADELLSLGLGAIDFSFKVRNNVASSIRCTVWRAIELAFLFAEIWSHVQILGIRTLGSERHGRSGPAGQELRGL